MDVLVLDQYVAEAIRAQRVEAGSARWDEVWDGVYVMSPLPNVNHQKLVARLVIILQSIIGEPENGEAFPGVNVSDRDDDWMQNYRCPDVAVFLRGGKAQPRDAYWLGGPDFAVEIASPYDRVREKIPFYASVGVRELLVIDRDPWKIELYRLAGQELQSVGRSSLDDPVVLSSDVLPLSLRVVPGADRPQIELTRRDGEGRRQI